MNEAVCKNCTFQENGICYVILWKDGKREDSRPVPEDGRCELWERKDD